MRRIGPADLDDHEVVRRDDDRVLALAADGHKTVGRHTGGNALAGGGGASALSPESRAVSILVRALRGEPGRVVDPADRQDALPALRHPVTLVQQTKACPISGAGPEM